MPGNTLFSIGEALIDMIPSRVGCTFDEVPSFSPRTGGAPANVCAAFARLGGASSFLTQLGDDPFGHKIARELEACGIDLSHLVFTDKAADALSTIANQRAQQEAGGARPDKMAFIAPFTNAHGLSKRETEVLTCLIQGRTMQYTAEKLFIAESTARTHVHKIYQKTESQGRMELLDCFEQFCAEQDGSRTGGRRR